MSTIEDNPQAGQRLICRVGRFTKFDVTADRIVDAARLTELCRIRYDNRLIDQTFNFGFQLVVQFLAVRAKKFHTVIVERIMTGTDHNTGLGRKGTGEVRDCRRRNGS